MSVSHYTRLEQGESKSISEEVLNAVGAALRLDADELDYLHRIARDPLLCVHEAVPVEVPAGLRYLLESFVMTPALVVGRHTQIISWNKLAVAVFGDFSALPENHRTLSHLLFVDSHMRTLLGAGWDQAARQQVAHLRALLGRYRGNARLAAHVADMRGLSPEFATLWSQHPVARFRSAAYALDHPIAGKITLHRELVALPDAPSCCGLDLFAAEPGSPSEQALRELAGLP